MAILLNLVKKSADASLETVYARAPLLGMTFCIVNTAPEWKAREIFRI